MQANSYNQPTDESKYDYLQDIETLTPNALKQKYPKSYSNWSNMKRRRNTHGAIIDTEFEPFRSFLEIMGPRPNAKDSIDRFDPDDPEYAPGKVRWANPIEQNRNQTKTIHLTYQSETLPLSEWAQKSNQPYSKLYGRYKRGWDHAEIITGFRRGKRGISSNEVTSIANEWCALLKEYHERLFVSVLQKERGLLRSIIDSLGVHALPAIRYAVTNWSKFRERAKLNLGAYNCPYTPTIDFFHRYRDEAVCMYLEHERRSKEPPQEPCYVKVNKWAD